MAFYELVFIVRQDVSSADVDKITEEFAKVTKDNEGEIIKTEYWGLRTIAYEINNNSKGHYVFFGLNAKSTTIKEVERKMRLHNDVIRFLTIKVDSISSEPSTILKGKENLSEEIIDVTLNKENI